MDDQITKKISEPEDIAMENIQNEMYREGMEKIKKARAYLTVTSGTTLGAVKHV